MRVRRLNTRTDFPILQKFWTAKGLPAVPEEYLPPTGLVVVGDYGFQETLFCGAYLVKSDAGMASIGYVAANPELPKHIRSKALDVLILELAGLAKEAGLPMVSVSTNVKALQARYERLGFVKTDENVTHYAGRV